jgi:hypothetical protein
MITSALLRTETERWRETLYLLLVQRGSYWWVSWQAWHNITTLHVGKGLAASARAAYITARLLQALSFETASRTLAMS